jgi:hypothetical protein
MVVGCGLSRHRLGDEQTKAAACGRAKRGTAGFRANGHHRDVEEVRSEVKHPRIVIR